MSAPTGTGSTTPGTPTPAAPTAPGSIQSGFSNAATGNLSPTAGVQQAQTQINPPAAAVSPYEYQPDVASVQILLGPQLGALLGLPGNTPVTGDQVMTAYYEMGSGALTNLEEMLYGANMYANTAGEPLGNRPVFGGRDSDSFNALSQLIIQAANTGMKQTADQIITSQTSTGAGFAAQQNALQPVLGGGNTYQVNLTNPQDVYQMTNQVFLSALGRLPTQQEYQAVLQQVQQQQTQSQQAQIGQEESMSQQRYQQQINSRTAEHTPAAVTGNAPNGPFTSPSQEAVAILQYGGYQVSPDKVAFLTAWIEQMGGAGPNPLGVTNVPNGASADQGIQMAVNLLHAPQYQALNALLTNTAPITAKAQQGVVQELNQWTGGAINATLNTKPYIQQSTDAVLQYGSQSQAQAVAPPPNAGTATPTTGLSGSNRANLGLAPAGQTATQAQAAQAGAIQQAAPGLQTGQQASPNQTPAENVGQNGQGMNAPGDNYLPSSTITDVQAASPQSVAFMEATSGANTTPYYANQAQAGLQAIINLIQQNAGSKV